MTLSQARRSGFSVAQNIYYPNPFYSGVLFDRQIVCPKGKACPVDPTLPATLAQLSRPPTTPESPNQLPAQNPGRWQRIRTHRPPLEDSHFTATA